MNPFLYHTSVQYILSNNKCPIAPSSSCRHFSCLPIRFRHVISSRSALSEIEEEKTSCFDKVACFLYQDICVVWRPRSEPDDDRQWGWERYGWLRHRCLATPTEARFFFLARSARLYPLMNWINMPWASKRKLFVEKAFTWNIFVKESRNIRSRGYPSHSIGFLPRTGIDHEKIQRGRDSFWAVYPTTRHLSHCLGPQAFSTNSWIVRCPHAVESMDWSYGPDAAALRNANYGAWESNALGLYIHGWTRGCKAFDIQDTSTRQGGRLDKAYTLDLDRCFILR